MNETLLWQIISIVLMLMLIYLSYGNMNDVLTAYNNGKTNCLNDYIKVSMNRTGK